MSFFHIYYIIAKKNQFGNALEENLVYDIINQLVNVGSGELMPMDD